MRLSLRQKLLLFAVVIAILPLVVAGRTLIRIAQDELKSSANDQLVVTAQRLVDEINDLYERTWLAPLVLIRNALDDPQLGVAEKISRSPWGSPIFRTSWRSRSRSRAPRCPWSWSRTTSPSVSRTPDSIPWRRYGCWWV